MCKEDFMNNYIFHEFKDSVLYGSDKFKKMIYGKYGILIDSSLYNRLVNYQIKRYGNTLSYNGRDYIKNFGNKSNKERRKFKENINNKNNLRRFEERNNGKNKIKKV